MQTMLLSSSDDTILSLLAEETTLNEEDLENALKFRKCTCC